MEIRGFGLIVRQLKRETEIEKTKKNLNTYQKGKLNGACEAYDKVLEVIYKELLNRGMDDEIETIKE